MKLYPSVNKLNKKYNSHNITYTIIESKNEDGFTAIKLKIDTKQWLLFVDDEYNDFKIEKPLISFYLIMLSLEMYDDSTDYLNWCFQNGIDAKKLYLLEYYKSLEKSYLEIYEILGDIDSCINPLDYQLRTGVVDALLDIRL